MKKINLRQKIRNKTKRIVTFKKKKKDDCDFH